MAPQGTAVSEHTRDKLGRESVAQHKAGGLSGSNKSRQSDIPAMGGGEKKKKKKITFRERFQNLTTHSWVKGRGGGPWGIGTVASTLASSRLLYAHFQNQGGGG